MVIVLNACSYYVDHGHEVLTDTRASLSTCVKYARIIVLVDNDCNPRKSELSCPWGISLLVVTPASTILFDTGPSPSALKRNAELLGIDLSSVRIIVLSHEHFDHIGGIPIVKELRLNITLYVPKGMDIAALSWIKRYVSAKHIVVVNHSTVIAPGVSIIGPLYGPPYEEALAINVCGFGTVLLTGCSHPGITSFVKYAKDFLKKNVTMVIGGFHLIGYSASYVDTVVAKLIREGVRFIAPLHCSGPIIRKLLSAKYPSHYVELYVGSEIVLDP